MDEIAMVWDMGEFTSVGGELESVRAAQLVPGGPSERTFAVTVDEIDREGAYCESSTQRTGFCVDVDGRLTCRIYTVEGRQICHDSYAAYENEEAPLEDLSHDVRGSIRVLESGRVRVEGELCVPAGEYDVEALVGRDDCGVPGAT